MVEEALNYFSGHQRKREKGESGEEPSFRLLRCTESRGGKKDHRGGGNSGQNLPLKQREKRHVFSFLSTKIRGERGGGKKKRENKFPFYQPIHKKRGKKGGRGRDTRPFQQTLDDLRGGGGTWEGGRCRLCFLKGGPEKKKKTCLTITRHAPTGKEKGGEGKKASLFVQMWDLAGGRRRGEGSFPPRKREGRSGVVSLFDDVGGIGGGGGKEGRQRGLFNLIAARR